VNSARDALIVAVDDYVDPGLGQLQAPHQDAEALGDVLGDPRIGDFAVRVLRNETAQGIRVAVEDFFADRRPDDLLVLHFSCHGLKNAAGELFLAAADSRPTRLASTAVAADFVNQQMADSRAQRIALFLDCCYGGAFPRGMVVRASGVVEVGDAFAAAQQAAGGRGRVVVTASSSVEYAFEGGQLKPGAQVAPSVFTGSVVEGLSTGEADRDGDGWVGLNELFTYVAERVRRATPHQTPHLWAFGSEGDLLLAHSRRRRVKADTLPAELTEAVSSSLPATRYGVAVELRDRLTGEDLGQALAAWNVLSGMVDDDSRRVSAFAITAMQQAGLQVSPAALDLGTRPAGQPSVHELVLTGSPLALAANADSADDWVRCEADAGRVQVTVAPEGPGDYAGTVVLATPIGDLQVPVRVEVVAAAAAIPKARRARVKPVAAPPADQVAAPPADQVAAPLVDPMDQPFVEPVGAPTPTLPAAAPTAAPPVAPLPVTEPADVSPSGEGAGPSRLWWPVSAALVAIAIGWLLAYLALYGDLLWYQPSADYLEPSFPYDGYGLAPVVVIVSVIGAMRWPRMAVIALGAATGFALFFLTWSVIFLGTSRISNDSSLAPTWWAFIFLGLATIAVVLLELWHRHLLRGRLPWRRPTFLEAGLIVLGAYLLVNSLSRKLDYLSFWSLYPGRSLLVPVLTVALTGWATVTRLSGDRAKAIVTAAVAYLAVSSVALLYVAVQAPNGPFARRIFAGNVAMLLAFAARLAQGRWGRLQLPKRKSSAATKASTPQ
jgi:hypothetical protein